jgi:hypothetical protein
MQSQYPQRRKSDVIVVELDSEVLIYDQKTNKAYNLNKTSAMIWELCDGKHSLSEISCILGEKLNAAVDDGLVWLALEQLRETDLVENEVALPESLTGLSRRQAIRKVGLAAVITLPFISSMIAPIPAHAASTPLTPTNQPINVPLFAPTPIPGPGGPTAPVPPSPRPIFAPSPIPT